MNNPLQKLIDEWYDWYVKQYHKTPTWDVFINKVNEFKFLLDIE